MNTNLLSVVLPALLLMLAAFALGGLKLPLQHWRAQEIIPKIYAGAAAIAFGVLLWLFAYDGLVGFFLGCLSEDDSGAWAELMSVYVIVALPTLFYLILCRVARCGAVVISFVWDFIRHQQSNRTYTCTAYRYRDSDGQVKYVLSGRSVIDALKRDQRRRSVLSALEALWRTLKKPA